MKKILLFLVVFLHPHIAVASGWVQWAEIQRYEPQSAAWSTEWMIEAGYPYFEVCYLKMQEKIQEDLKMFEELKRQDKIITFGKFEDSVFMAGFNDHGLMKKYYCLPDTVDPRLK